MDPLKVFIDDHFFVVRQGIKAQLSVANIDIVGEAANQRQVYAQLLGRHTPVDMLVLEVGMPEVDPIRLIRELRAGDPAVKILVFTGALNPWRNAELFQCGVDGILLKTDNTALAVVVDRVARGEAYYSPEVWHWRGV